MTLNTRKPRTYCYRIPLDDTAAMLRLRRFKRKSEYWISELPDREVPNVNAVKNWGVVFYKSKETHGDYPDEFEGGAIPGLEEYRHSLDWEPTPETELLEMKRHHKGGTKIRGEQFLGTHDPRLSDYVPIEITVPWTVREIKQMFDGEDVPNKADYSHDPPMMKADMARAEYRRMIEQAKQDGFEELREKLWEYEENCNHDHTLEDPSDYGDVGYCEDCGRTWQDREEMEATATIVGSA